MALEIPPVADECTPRMIPIALRDLSDQRVMFPLDDAEASISDGDGGSEDDFSGGGTRSERKDKEVTGAEEESWKSDVSVWMLWRFIIPEENPIATIE